MSIEINKPTVEDPEALRKEWQEKHDPNLNNLHGMRKFIEDKMGGQPPTATAEDQGKFNNFQ